MRGECDSVHPAPDHHQKEADTALTIFEEVLKKVEKTLKNRIAVPKKK